MIGSLSRIRWEEQWPLFSMISGVFCNFSYGGVSQLEWKPSSRAYQYHFAEVHCGRHRCESMHGSEKVLQCKNIGASGHVTRSATRVPGAGERCGGIRTGRPGFWKVRMARQGQYNPLCPKPSLPLSSSAFCLPNMLLPSCRNPVLRCTPSVPVQSCTGRSFTLSMS